MYSSTQRKHLLLSTAIALALSPAFAQALPTGGTVASGTATISSTPGTTTIKQTSGQAIINWTGFNTTNGQTVDFVAPNASSITLNRISGGETTFNGALNANGQVWFTNPEGFIFGSTAKVNVGSLLATTSNFTGAGGQYAFAPGGGSASATVSNAGSITVADAGLAALVAPHVANSGTITAKAGTITLASGDTFTVDLASDGLINLAASKAMTQQGLANTGTLNATGGSVVLTAAIASNVLDNLINLDGVIVANSLTADNESGDLEYGAKFTGSTGGNVTLSAYRNVSIDSNVVIAPASGKLNVTLDSDDTSWLSGDNGQSSGNIYMASGSQIKSNGGNILLGGGYDTNGYAMGDTVAGKDAAGYNVHSDGILLDGASLIAAGGNISLMGQSLPGSTGNVWAEGVHIGGFGGQASTVSTSGAGTIFIEGKGSGETNGQSDGVDIQNTTLQSASGAVKIVGVGEDAASSTGVALLNGTLTTTSGAINVTGYSGDQTNAANMGIEDSDKISTGSGAITLTGAASASGGTNTGIQMGGAGITSNTGNVVLNGSVTNGTGSNTGVEITDESVLKSTGTGSTAASFTINSTGSNLDTGLTYSSFSTVDGNFTFNSNTPFNETGSTFKSTGKGIFAFNQ